MIHFQKLTYSNFLSSGTDPITIDFDKTKTTLVVGTNGAGKSTMLDALSFALFGKPHRNINKGQLCNTINGKKCEVSIEFKVNNHQYRVLRGIKPNKFEIYRDGEEVNQESHARDFQKVLENNILKLNHRSFHQVVVLGSSSFIPFMELTAAQRREVVEDLLDIRIFAKMNDILKEEIHSKKNVLKDHDAKIALVEEKIRMQSKHIFQLESITEKNNKQIEKEIRTLSDDIKSLNVEIEKGKDECQKLMLPLEAEKRSKEDKLNKLLGFERQFNERLERIKKEIEFYDENNVCPTCHSEITQEHKCKKKEDLNRKSEQDQKSILELGEAILETRSSLSDYQSSLSEVDKKRSELISKQGLVIEKQTQLQKLKSKPDSSESSSDIDKVKDELNRFVEEKTVETEKRDVLKSEQEYNSALSAMLKDTGIKTKVVKQYLPVMNQLINRYLNILDFFVSFNLDDNFNETIKSRHRDIFSYPSFSEGEKSRINLALLFAWRHISKMKNSLNTNLLILDEVMDSSLDVDGVSNLMRILEAMGDGTNTFVISHKKEFSDGKFDRKLTFTKPKNFSKMQETND